MTGLQEQYEKETGKSWFTNPVCHGELGFASWEYQKWLEEKITKIYSTSNIFEMKIHQCIDLNEEMTEKTINVSIPYVAVMRVNKGWIYMFWNSVSEGYDHYIFVSEE